MKEQGLNRLKNCRRKRFVNCWSNVEFAKKKIGCGGFGESEVITKRPSISTNSQLRAKIVVGKAWTPS